MKKNILLFVFFFLSIKISAQVEIDSLKFISALSPVSTLNTFFDKHLNTYNLNSLLNFNRNFGNFNILLSEDFKSTYIKASENSIRDEQFFKLLTSYSVMSSLLIGIEGENNILSDNRQLDINQASSSNVSFFANYLPENRITIAPFFGYMNNQQIGENDYGFVYGAEGLINNIDLTDFNLFTELKFSNEDISPRKNTSRVINLSVTNNISRDVINSIDVIYSENRKDFYFNADSITSAEFNIENNIQSRIERNYLLRENLFAHGFLNIFSLDFSGRVFYREVDKNRRYKALGIEPVTSLFDTRIDELRLELESQLSYNSDFFNGFLRIFFSQRDEKNITKDIEGVNEIFFREKSETERMKDNNSLRASLAVLSEFKLSKKDNIYFSFFQNKLRYDTPSDRNFDDRDEVLSILRLKYTRKISTFFEAFVSTEGTLNQTAYIFSEKSSNNNINRVLKLSSGGNYRGKNFSSLNTFEVSANYTVYDYEDINPNFKSYSFRQFSAIDSTKILLSRRFVLSSYGYIKLSEQGELKWGEFKTAPNRYLEEFFLEPKISLIYGNFFLSLGLRYFELNTFNYNKSEKIIDTEYKSIGPLSELFLIQNEILLIKIYGWYEFIKVSRGENREQVNLNMQVTWNF